MGILYQIDVPNYQQTIPCFAIHVIICIDYKNLLLTKWLKSTYLLSSALWRHTLTWINIDSGNELTSQGELHSWYLAIIPCAVHELLIQILWKCILWFRFSLPNQVTILSWAVVPCAKLDPDLTSIFAGWDHNLFMKWVSLFWLRNTLMQNWMHKLDKPHRNIATVSFSVNRHLHIGSTTYLPMHELCNLKPESGWTRFDGRDTTSVILKGYQFPIDI